MQLFAALAPILAEKAQQLEASNAWTLVIVHGLATRYGPGVERTGKRLGLSLRGKAEQLLEMKPAQLQAIALEIIASNDPSSTWRTGGWSTELAAIARACQVDLGKAMCDAKKSTPRAREKHAAAVTFLAAELKGNPQATFAELKTKAAEKGITVHPIEFGRARALLGIVTPRQTGKGKAKTTPTLAGVATCRGCGCTDTKACVVDGEPCHWVEADLCSACAGKQPARRLHKKTQTKVAKAVRA
jgi:hypothetical protein